MNGNPNKNQWKRIDLRADELVHKEMMLSTDLCLAMNGDPQANDDDSDSSDDEDEGGNPGGPSPKAKPLLAQTHNCCAWVEEDSLDL